MTTYRSFLQRIMPTVLRTEPGRRLIGTIALLWDSMAEACRQAVRAPWIDDTTGPAYDALAPAGSELSLPRYPAESWTQYHNRLKRPWDDWPTAGHETSILAQLTAAGYPGAVIYSPQNADLENDDYWSQFIVFYPIGTHPVTSPGPLWGSFVWGDGTLYGPTGIDPEHLRALRRIIRKFKAGHWICRWLVFEISGWTYGTGHTWGETDLTWGGTRAVVGV